jgi:hypothetical protein
MLRELIINPNFLIRAGSWKSVLARLCLWGFACLLAITTAFAGYKAREWKIRALNTYPAHLVSEGVTIAVEPLFQDSMANQVFDKNDMIASGIMPVAVVIFNDNGFPVEVECKSIELILGDDHMHPLDPRDAVAQLSRSKGKGAWKPQIGIKLSSGSSSMLDDFEAKYLAGKVVGPHQTKGGFLYFQIAGIKELRGELIKGTIYIPEIVRNNTGEKMMFFEIELKPAIETYQNK